MKNLLMTFILLGSLLACNSSDKSNDIEPSVRPVKYVKVGTNNITGQHNFTGLAKAQQEANLSFKVSGTLNNIRVKVGDRVKAGQTLATLDPTDYQVNLSQSLANVESSKAQTESTQAQLESAKANYIIAESNYKRFEKLYETNSISLSDFEQARSSFKSAEASLKAAETQLQAAKASTSSTQSAAKNAQNQVSYTVMQAPFSGVITEVRAEANELVGQGNPIININSEIDPDVEIGVPENFISELESNQKVKVKFNSIHEMTYEGVIHEVGYSSAGSTYPVTVRLTNGDDRIRPGMPANAMIKFDDHHTNKSALIVPAASVGEDDKGNFVYKIIAQGEAQQCTKQYVKVGELTDVGFEVISGLNNGDLVASAGLNILSDGMKVSLYSKQ